MLVISLAKVILEKNLVSFTTNQITLSLTFACLRVNAAHCFYRKKVQVTKHGLTSKYRN